jgi:hypothetical protein
MLKGNGAASDWEVCYPSVPTTAHVFQETSADDDDVDDDDEGAEEIDDGGDGRVDIDLFEVEN